MGVLACQRDAALRLVAALSAVLAAASAAVLGLAAELATILTASVVGKRGASEHIARLIRCRESELEVLRAALAAAEEVEAPEHEWQRSARGGRGSYAQVLEEQSARQLEKMVQENALLRNRCRIAERDRALLEERLAFQDDGHESDNGSLHRTPEEASPQKFSTPVMHS